MSDDGPTCGWIEDIELEDVEVMWAWSHFDGRADTYNDEGDHNFQIILPEETARKLQSECWNVTEREGYEEGDPPRFLLKAKISYKYEAPRVYLIKNGRKFPADKDDLRDITRSATEQIDVILTPSRWVNGNRSGVTAYVKELYATIKQSRFADKYADYESI